MSKPRAAPRPTRALGLWEGVRLRATFLFFILCHNEAHIEAFSSILWTWQFSSTLQLTGWFAERPVKVAPQPTHSRAPSGEARFPA